MKCPKCGKEIDINDKYCGYCGTEIKIQDKSPNKNKVIIAILGCVIALGIVAIIFVNKSNHSKHVEEKTNINEKTNTSEKTNNDDETVQNSASIHYSLSDVTASSTLGNEGKISYNIANITDNNSSTAWVEGKNGDGIGEYVEFDYTGPVYLSSITIANGYRKSESLYYKNNRVKELKIVLDDGTYKVLSLGDDYYNSIQTFDLNLDVSSKSFKIYIESVYHGNKYDDTCIDEISITIK